MGPDMTEAADAGSKMEAQLRLIKMIAGGVGAVVALILVIVFAVLAWKWWLHPHAKVAWSVPVGGGSRHHVYVEDEQGMIVQMGDTIYSVDLMAGKMRWQYSGADKNWAYVEFGPHGALLGSERQLLRLNADGKEIWKLKNDGSQQFLARTDDVVFILHRTKLDYATWKEHRLAEMNKAQREDAERYNYLDEDSFGGGWDNAALVAYAMNENKELWRQKMRPRMRLSPLVAEGELATICTTRVTAGRPKTHVLCFNAKTGQAHWRAPVKKMATTTPYLQDGNVIFRDFAGVHILNAAGQPQTDVQLRPYSFTGMRWGFGNAFSADDDDDDDEDEETDEDGGRSGVYVDEDGVLLSMKNGKKQWQFKLAGGVLDFSVSESVLVLTAHTTKEGWQSEHLDGAAQMLGGGGELSGMVATGLAVADFVIVGLDRNSGKELWRIEDLTGEIVCSGGRVLVLQDTRKTSVVIRNSGAIGQLLIHQLDPATGKVYYTRKFEDVRLDRPRIRGEHLTVIAYQREGGKDAPCLGFQGLTIK
jgi:outer membrane protein assembly factor BamB